MTMDDDRKRARRNVILAVVHVLLAVAVLIGFVYAQSHR
jgi:predicted negative regulator of RcsB-dependent stress response